MNDPMNDPIIKQMLSKRAITEPIDDASDIERQKRMYHMLVHSKQYRKLSISRANDAWKDLTSNSDYSKCECRKKVSFNDSVIVIPVKDSGPEIPNFMNKIKDLFKK